MYTEGEDLPSGVCVDVSVEMIVACVVRRSLVVHAIEVIFTGTIHF